MQVNDVVAYIQAGRDRFLADLKEWLAIPSISGDPAYAAEVRRSAEWLAAHLREQGFPTVETWETAGLPAVFAEWPAADPGAPTVVIYGHHDVQPVEPLSEWETDPFKPVICGMLLTGREPLYLTAHLTGGHGFSSHVGIDLRLSGRVDFRYSFSETMSRNPISPRLTPPAPRRLANFQNLFGLVGRF